LKSNLLREKLSSFMLRLIQHPSADPSTEMTMNSRILLVAVAALAVGGAVTIAAPKSAQALPAYAASTGKACGACHQNPAGGGPRNAFGEAFAANGHKLPAKK
jgi:mono/diheme cytochrome c family protein